MRMTPRSQKLREVSQEHSQKVLEQQLFGVLLRACSYWMHALEQSGMHA